MTHCRGQHVAFYLALAEEAESQLSDSVQGAWLERLESEHDNLRAALRWCASNGDTDSELRLAVALTRFWRRRGHLAEGRAWLSAALAHDRHAPSAIRARGLDGLSALAIDQADYDVAEGARAAVSANLSRTHRVWAGQHGGTRRRRWDLQRASSELQESASLFHQLNASDLAYCLHRVADIALLKGEYAGLRTSSAQAIAIFRELGHKVGVTWGLLCLGRAAYETGDFPQARTLLQEALEQSLAIRDIGQDAASKRKRTVGRSQTPALPLAIPQAHVSGQTERQ